MMQNNPIPVLTQFEQNPLEINAVVMVLYFEKKDEEYVSNQEGFEIVPNVVSQRAELIRVINWNYEF